MSFASPWLLLFLLLVPLAVLGYWLLERQRAHRAEAWSRGALMPNMVPTSPGKRRYVPLALFLIALVLLLAGFARPQAEINVPREGATVVIVLDISGSMEAKDVVPGPTTRLNAARAAITEFLDDLPDKYRVSLVTYGNRGTVRVAPTNDHERLLEAIPKKAGAEGTVLASGIERATRIAQSTIDRTAPPAERRPAAVVLLIGDGGNSGQTDPAEAAQAAQKLKVPIYTVALGTAGPDAQVVQPIPNSPGNDEVIQVPVDPELLKEIAQTTGGKFVEATTPGQLKPVTEEIPSRFVDEKRKREITVAVAGAAAVFLIAGALLSGFWFRRVV
jgi:Ca-activated chloride channel family protein